MRANINEPIKNVKGNQAIQAEELRQNLEKTTKQYNVTLSLNQKKRGDINQLRKERTLFDNVFKELETKILKDEQKIIELLKSRQKIDEALSASEANIEGLTSNINKNDEKGIALILKDE